ncbi:MAG: hypothetical protein IIU78_00490 [Alistipes sp.]|nr:hypothetical protein [Alistipes sp.]
MNRIIGTLFALATLAAIAYAIYNAGSYTSICFTEEYAPAEEVVDVIPEHEIAIERDSVEVVMELRDSLQQ